LILHFYFYVLLIYLD